MKVCEGCIGLTLSEDQWFIFLERLLAWNKRYRTLHIQLFDDRFVLRRMSPVPRDFVTTIFFERKGAEVVVVKARMESIHGRLVPSNTEELKFEIETLIDAYLDDSLDE